MQQMLEWASKDSLVALPALSDEQTKTGGGSFGGMFFVLFGLSWRWCWRFRG